MLIRRSLIGDSLVFMFRVLSPPSIFFTQNALGLDFCGRCREKKKFHMARHEAQWNMVLGKYSYSIINHNSSQGRWSLLFQREKKDQFVFQFGCKLERGGGGQADTRPGKSPPALSPGLQWDRSSSSLNQQDKYLLWNPLYQQINSLVNILSISRSTL